jgi:probable phosphomutase (TIGR03848 family)
MLLFLIRHALTPVTGKSLSGWLPGYHLSDEGRNEAEAMADRMRAVRLDAIYASPLERAMETARPLARAQGLRIRVRDDLGEVRYGDWEGRSLRALSRTKLWRRVMSRPSEVRFPGGEAIRETQIRAVNAVERIRTDHDKGAVAAVSHADIIRLLVAHYAGVHLDLYQRVAVGTASVSVVWLGGGGPRVLKLNDTGSLTGVAPPRRPAKASR